MIAAAPELLSNKQSSALKVETPTDRIASVVTVAEGMPNGWHHDAPWSLSRRDDHLELRLERLREERVGDIANRELVIACGALLENIRVAAGREERTLEVHTFPSPDDDCLIATVRIDDQSDARGDEDALYDSVTVSTPPLVSRGRKASPALLAVLRDAARRRGGWIDLVCDDPRRAMLGDLEFEATIIAEAERGARRIIASRREVNAGSHIHVTHGGDPTLADLLRMLGCHALQSPAWESERTARATYRRSRIADATIVAVVGSSGDLAADWLATGATLQNVLLHADVHGLSATLLNAPLLHPLLRDAVEAIVVPDGAAQAILCFELDDTAG